MHERGMKLRARAGEDAGEVIRDMPRMSRPAIQPCGTCAFGLPIGTVSPISSMVTRPGDASKCAPTVHRNVMALNPSVFATEFLRDAVANSRPGPRPPSRFSSPSNPTRNYRAD